MTIINVCNLFASVVGPLIGIINILILIVIFIILMLLTCCIEWYFPGVGFINKKIKYEGSKNSYKYRHHY